MSWSQPGGWSGGRDTWGRGAEEGRDTGKVFFGTGTHSGGMWPDEETAGKSQYQQ